MFSLARLVPGRRCRNYLSQFTEDPSLAREEQLWFTVKHKKQVALNRVVRQRLTVGKPMRVLGGKTNRVYRDGLLVGVDKQGCTSATPMREPFGIDKTNDRVAIATGNTISLYELSKQEVTVFEFEWFAQLHSVTFSADGSRLLVASTGYDTVIEFDIGSAHITWFWCSWDNGYDYSPSGVRLRRSVNGIRIYKQEGNFDSSERLEMNEFGLPTGYSATHLNNARYFDDDSICITLFHQGRAILVDRQTGVVSEVLRGLLNPHGFEPAWDGEKIVTDTRRGRAIFFDEDFLVKHTLIFDRDEPVPERKGLGEWLQNVLPLSEGLYGAIDIHRSCIWIVNIEKKTYRKMEISKEWAVQNIISVDADTLGGLHEGLAGFKLTSKKLSDPEGISSIKLSGRLQQ